MVILELIFTSIGFLAAKCRIVNGSADDGKGHLDCKVADFGLHVLLAAVDQDKDVKNLCAISLKS